MKNTVRFISKVASHNSNMWAFVFNASTVAYLFTQQYRTRPSQWIGPFDDQSWRHKCCWARYRRVVQEDTQTVFYLLHLALFSCKKGVWPLACCDLNLRILIKVLFSCLVQQAYLLTWTSERFFPGVGHEGIFPKFFYEGADMVEFVFSLSKPRKQPFYAEIFKIPGSWHLWPPFRRPHLLTSSWSASLGASFVALHVHQNCSANNCLRIIYIKALAYVQKHLMPSVKISSTSCPVSMNQKSRGDFIGKSLKIITCSLTSVTGYPLPIEISGCTM